MIPPQPAEAWEIAALLDAARAIPAEELPSAAALAALLAAIRSGQVIGVYTPIGSTRHNIELAHEIAGPRDPRLSCAEWIARYRATLATEQGGEA
jgi:hypothetical protein